MIVEHQVLTIERVLSYRTDTEDDIVPQMLKSIKENIAVLGLHICGNIIIAKHENALEFLIPVNKEFRSNSHYEFKSEFKLVNAARFRHYGSFSKIQAGLTELNGYIRENSLTQITDPYIVEKDITDNVYDIYVGISENVL